MKPIYIFGHKNPDTDSVCSAIALSYLKNRQKIKSIPKIIGPISNATKFVLDYFKIDYPSYLNDVKVQIKDVHYTKNAYINETDCINNAHSFMKDHDLTAIPLVDNKKILKGYVTLKDMAKYLISGKRDYIKTNLKHLLQTLDAKIITNFQNEFEGNVKMVSLGSDTFIKEVPLDSNSILIVGDRYKVIEYAIASKVQLIILTRGRVIPVKLLNKAIKNKVNIITSAYTSFELCNRVFLANYISLINDTPNPTTIDIHGFYTDFISLTKRLNYTNYPVVNKNNECLGVLKLTDSLLYEKQKVILVDHNNFEQSIEGLNEAEIVEIIDHHNIGSIGTNLPISFTSRPVGCTATIVYDEFIKSKIAIPKDIAGILLSSIISDTLLFTSPTTTQADIDTANKLAKLAKLDLDTYGKEMLKAASSLKGLTINEIINQDFKSYLISDKNYGIAVTTTMDYEEIEKDLDKYIDRLNEMSKSGYKAVLMFVTDIIKKGSYVLYNKDSENLIADTFKLKKVYEGMFIEDLISRKKQILPALMKEVEK